MVKAKGNNGEGPGNDKEELWKGMKNKNGEKREDGSKSKGLLGTSMSGQDLKPYDGGKGPDGKGQDGKGQDFSPIRKSYRLAEPKKHQE